VIIIFLNKFLIDLKNRYFAIFAISAIRQLFFKPEQRTDRFMDLHAFDHLGEEMGRW